LQTQQRKRKLEWLNIGSSWSIVLPIKTHAGDGRYAIDILRRPAYCNRGDWLIRVSGYNSDLIWTAKTVFRAISSARLTKPRRRWKRGLTGA
jgi:hypothetical protein